MKAAGTFSLNIFGFICFFLALIAGCSDYDSHKPIASNVPGQEQLHKSEFAKFVDELKLLPLAQRITFVQKFLIDNPYSPIIEENGIACFYWFGDAKTVFINGDIQSGWSAPEDMNMVSCGREKFFYKIYSLPADARVEYQFIVDNNTITDSRNPVTTPTGFGLNSQCAMPLFKTKTIRDYRPGIERGTVDSILFESSLTTMKPRMLKIYKPAGYDSLRNLPALYVNDGFKALEFSSYINVLDNLIADKMIKPVIVVFIDFVEGDQTYFLDSISEYITAVCDEMIPLVDSKYRTSESPGNRVLAGISAGGHASLTTSLKRPDIFLNSAGQSSAITAELLDAVDRANSNPETANELNLYFDVGRFDLVQGRLQNYSFLYANQLLGKELKKAKINHRFNVYNDGHQWANWRERVDEILIYFFGI